MQQVVVYVGHSFVRRMQDHCQTFPASSNLGLSPLGHRIIFHWIDEWGHKILTILDLLREVASILRLAPRIDLLILDIGTNDINDRSSMAPERIHRLLQDFVESMLQGGVRHVSMVPVTFRHGVAAICRDDGGDTSFAEAESAFQHRAHFFNSLSAQIAADQARVSVVSNRGLQACWRRWVDFDGVHLSPEGLILAARNLRSAIIHGCRVALGQAGPPHL